MKWISVVIICLHFFIHTIRCSNILVFMPSPWKSHIISFQPFFLELASRGHNVTVVSKFTIENPPPGYVQLVPSYYFDINESKIHNYFNYCLMYILSNRGTLSVLKQNQYKLLKRGCNSFYCATKYLNKYYETLI